MVLAYDPSRFGRDAAEAITACKTLEQAGVAVQTVTVDISQPVVRNLFFTLGEEESRTKSTRVRDALLRIAEQGRWPTRPPMGYDLATEKGKPGGVLKPNKHGKAIARIFKLYAEGKISIRALPATAARLGLKQADGRPLARQVIYRLLKNPAYKGDIVYNRQARGKFTGNGQRDPSAWIVVEDAHKAIVDRETWDAVQERFRFNHRHHAAVRKTAYLCTSFIWCGQCGQRMQGWVDRRNGKSGGPYPYYRCMKRLEYGACDLPFIRAEAIDDAVRDVLLKFFPDPNPPGARDVFIKSVMNALGQHRIDVNRLERQRDRHRRRLAELLEEKLEGVPIDIVREKVAVERKALAAVEKELEAAEKEGDDGVTPERIGALWDWMSTLEWPPARDHLAPWRLLLESYVERIEVHSANDVRIELNEAGRTISRAPSRRPPCR